MISTAFVVVAVHLYKLLKRIWTHGPFFFCEVDWVVHSPLSVTCLSIFMQCFALLNISAFWPILTLVCWGCLPYLTFTDLSAHLLWASLLWLGFGMLGNCWVLERAAYVKFLHSFFLLLCSSFWASDHFSKPFVDHRDILHTVRKYMWYRLDQNSIYALADATVHPCFVRLKFP